MDKFNLLLICPDQLRADYLGCYGHRTIGTSNIDRLASDGVRLDKCYCAAPLCGPSRISFATSTYFSEHNHRDYGSTISPDVPNIVTSLKARGYRAGMFGKNHLFTYSRLREVWDELDEICLGNYDNHPDYKHSYSAFTLAPDHPYNITARLTDETIDFMSRSPQPFVAWVNWQDPHPAYTCPPPYDTMFDPADMVLPASFGKVRPDRQPARNQTWRVHAETDVMTEDDMRRAMAMYMGQVRYVDDSVGRLMAALERLKLLENTLVVFFADHGELLGDFRMTHKLPAFYECLCRIPVIIRHPGGRWAGTTFRGLVEEVDLAPTILQMLGVETPPTMVGRSLTEALERGDDRGRDTLLVEAGGGAPTPAEPTPGMKLRAPFAPTSFGPGAMIRKGDWKLSIYADDRCELYDLASDPDELVNRYDDPSCEGIRQQLTLELLKRVLSTKVRDVGLKWPRDKYPIDVRFAPLEGAK